MGLRSELRGRKLTEDFEVVNLGVESWQRTGLDFSFLIGGYDCGSASGSKRLVAGESCGAGPPSISISLWFGSFSTPHPGPQLLTEASTPQPRLTEKMIGWIWANQGQVLSCLSPTLLLDIAGRIDVRVWFSSVHWLLFFTELETSLAYFVANNKYSWKK